MAAEIPFEVGGKTIIGVIAFVMLVVAGIMLANWIEKRKAVA